MTLAAGTRLGPYEVLGSLGAGGMGEVCRARDTKLGRDVALKVLPEAFGTDPDRMSRFQREAQLLAALNHPNIAAIYGLEDGGARRAIVMELVEGQTLPCPLPVDEALRIAKQIAEAIEYAHERGIIHRDLKPANIKVTADGAVKVLDFGLAKAMDEVSDAMVNIAGSMSPTLSLGATYAGVIMGTAAYMAPEQAKGRPADRRSDVWAFGIVLYEMLTGDRMFGGDSVPETLASVMKDPITFGKLPDGTPHPIRTLVARCLERDPRRRLQSIGEARIVIEDVIAGVAERASPQPAPVAATPSRWPWVIAGMAIVVALGTLAWMWSRPASSLPAVARYTIPPPDGTTLTAYRSFASNIALSPDGRYIAFVADEQGRERTLWVRAINSLTAQRLDRTEDAAYPFWSPDSQHIAYFAKGKLMRVALAGGAPLPICDAVDGEGGAWYQPPGQDGIIVFAGSQNGPLHRVLAQGGVPTPMTKLGPGEASHIFPQFLPDGRFLYLARGEKYALYVQSPDSSDRKFVMNVAGRALFSPPGFLLYLRDNTLLAHRWNLDTLQLQGEPVLVTDDVRSGGGNGRNAFTVSANGVLAYRAGGSGRFLLTWYTREGKPDGTVLEAGENGPFELSPDEKHLVVEIGTVDDRDLWLKDLVSGALSRITSAPGTDRSAVWSPDSRRIAFFHAQGEKYSLLQTAIGSGKFTPAADDRTQTVVHEWTSDGKSLLTGVGGSLNLVALADESTSSAVTSKPKTLFTATYSTSQFRTSPDGKWIAYTSQETGVPQVVVATFPGFTDRRQVSTAPAAQPLWRADGKELFFIQRDGKLVALDITTRGSTIEFGPIRALFPVGAANLALLSRSYAVTRDGQRFLVRDFAGANQASAEQLYMVMNWTALVGR
jgi:eukaryotic-like serine/threonine-protein kinase